MGRRAPTLPQRIAIDQLLTQGHSNAQIAKALNLTPSQCSTQAIQDAKALLGSAASKLVEDYLNASHHAAVKGDHRPARDMLDRLHVTEPVQSDAASVGISVTVQGFTFPGLPVQVAADGSVSVARQAQTVPAPPALPVGEVPLTLDVQAERLSPVSREGVSEGPKNQEREG